MITIKMFGSLRLKTNFKGMEVYCSDVAEACGLVARATGYPEKELRNCIHIVNNERKKLSYKLNDGEELIFMSPSGGG